MKDDVTYYVVTKRAVPEVLLKVVEAKELLKTKDNMTVQKAADQAGISRSSFYKYKDDIFPFHDHTIGRTITVMMQLEDEPGLLSGILNCVAGYHANILTIHQAIPAGGLASVTLSIEVLDITENASELLDALERMEGVHYFKLLSRS